MTADEHDATTVSLTWPLAAIGLAGGWLTADALGLGSNEAAPRWLLVGITPVTAGCFGWWLSVARRTDDGVAPRFLGEPLTSAFLVALATLFAGVLNGAVIGLFAVPIVGAIAGSIFGLFCAVPFIPAIGATVWAARVAGRARPGSLVDGVSRRAVWAAVVGSVALACAMVWSSASDERRFYGPPRDGGIGPVVTILLCVAAILLLAADAAALVRTRLAAADLARMVDAAESDPVEPAAASVLDLGLGAASHVEKAPSPTVYRARERVLRIIRGSPAEAEKAIRVALLRGALVVAACALAAARVHVG